MPEDITGDRVLTAEDLDRMTAEERQAAFDARVVTDLSQLPAEYVAGLQARGAALVARRGGACCQSGRAARLVTSPRRDVRPTRDFYLALEHQLAGERGPAGQPSRADFQFHKLVPIFTRFATGWDHLPRLVPGRDDYRILVVRGVLLRAISVIGQLAPDGVIELVDLELNTTWPDDGDGVDHDDDSAQD